MRRYRLIMVSHTLGIALAYAVTFPGSLLSESGRNFIIGGEPAPDPEYGAIGRFVSVSECSLVFVSSNVALTAAHCIEPISFGFPVYAAYGDIYEVEHRVQVFDKGFHPSYCPSCRTDWYDYGYVVLDRELPADVPVLEPIASPEIWDRFMVDGTELEAVGFGCTEPDGGGQDKRSTAVATLHRFSPHGTVFSTTPNIGCDGDSGGAAVFRDENGKAWLGGILSKGLGDHETFFGTPYPALCWLRDETGLDFVGESCSACDCIDLPVSETSAGCKSSIAGEPGRAAPLAVLLLLICGRRPNRAQLRHGNPTRA